MAAPAFAGATIEANVRSPPQSRHPQLTKKSCPTLFRCASLYLSSFNLQAKAAASQIADTARIRPPLIRRTQQFGGTHEAELS